MKAFRRLPQLQYVTVDLLSSLASVKGDLTALPFATHSFDALLCVHVLEHIPDDRTAIQELYRVLKPAGWAIIQVPIDKSRLETFEDPAIQSADEKAFHYGNVDHVRLYGEDFKARLEETGFQVVVDTFVQEFSDEEIRRFVLDREEEVFYCVKLPVRKEFPPLPILDAEHIDGDTQHRDASPYRSRIQTV